MCNSEFEQVYDRNYEALCLYANRLIHSMTESEDLVQEIFVRFWELRRKGEVQVSVRAYLYRMVRNACIDRLRQKKITVVDVDVMADQLEDFFQPESEEGAAIDRLLKAVNDLPEKCRQVFVGICVNEKKYKEMADEMQVSVNTIKTQLARSLKLLRETLSREDYQILLTFFTNLL